MTCAAMAEERTRRVARAMPRCVEHGRRKPHYIPPVYLLPRLTG